jgi:serine protease AprX
MPANTAYTMTSDEHSLYKTVQGDLKASYYWDRGYTGAGVTVAVIDTGTAPVDGLNKAGKVIYGPDLSFESQSPYAYIDGFGHGTHMASIIAGRDTAFTGTVAAGTQGTVGAGAAYVNNTDKYLGIAPDATILSMKVGDHYGAVDISQLIAAITWVVEHKNDVSPPVRVLNLSYGVALDGLTTWKKDQLSYYVDQATRAGIVVVVPAGNDGQQQGTLLNSPGWNENVISVGAYDPQYDQVSGFSSDSGHRHPDFVVAGQSIAAPRVCGSAQDTAIAEAGTKDTSYAGTRFVRGSGTSQASAVAAGSAALILSKNPCFSPEQVKSVMRQSSVNLAGWTPLAVGSGAPDMSKAYNETRECGGPANFNGSARGEDPLDISRGAEGQIWDPSLYCAEDGGWLQTSRDRVLAMFPGTSAAYFDQTACHTWGRIFAQSDGKLLGGERDIYNKAWDTAAMATKATVDRATKTVVGDGVWTNANVDTDGDGVTEPVEKFNGSVWTGSGFAYNTGLGAQAWNPAKKVSLLWNGVDSSQGGWNGARWNGGRWNGARWNDDAWAGGRWQDSSWLGGRWNGARWNGARWNGARWNGARWNCGGWL